MSRNFVNYQDLLIPLWQLTKVDLYIKKCIQKKYSTFSLKKCPFIFLFCHRVSISEFHASNIPTQYKKITNKPFGNWYLCALIQLKRFSPVYSIVGTYILYGSRKRRNERRWFFFRPHSPSQETYYIVYTRYKKYLSKYNQGCDLRPSKFDVFIIYCII